ncbi:unnamed protein product [Cylindrotheca closterium]|uniref:Uncharacterized protein n=1 Tax=Cylindrotheca closterium TaxID=2856 RepID=A0AAD2G1P3_9STRA|nr:unnamed protein product [Cylindrotheca closterium]
MNDSETVSKSQTASSETAVEVQETTSQKECCSWHRFDGVRKAQGYAFAGLGNGSIAISNVFLSTSFIYLASKEVGCIDENGRLTPCDIRVHGFYPTTLVTNVAVFAGLLCAFALPVIGAIIDYTSHRRLVGRIVGFLIWLIQTIQIFTLENTWFPMIILQAIVVALFEIHYCLMVSYLPDIARYEVSHDTMTRFNRIFFCLQYCGQVTSLLAVLVVSFVLKFNSIESAHLGQSISSIILLICYTTAWRRLPKVQGPHKLPEGKSLLLQGFRHNFKTVQLLLKSPNRTLKWFFLTVMISEAGGTSLLPVVVSFYSRVLRYNSIDVGLTFFVAVLMAIPGAIVNAYFCRRHNPKISLRVNFVFTFSITMVAPFVLTAENPPWLGYVWGVLWGFSLGWMYSGEQLFYTLCMPESQETEFAGFFVYCTVILTWLPSLIYSTIVEKGYKEQYGLGSLCALQLIAMGTIAMVPNWDEVIEGSKMKLLAPPEPAVELPTTTTVAAAAEGISSENTQDLGGERSDSSDVEIKSA